mmetsp:Transcript_14160/g.34067  ORF Transcript_14160/g.34067 Transcript_14160/m.34067 type:complete len:231 (-) Transcript_14160:154-846(-)
MESLTTLPVASSSSGMPCTMATPGDTTAWQYRTYSVPSTARSAYWKVGTARVLSHSSYDSDAFSGFFVKYSGCSPFSALATMGAYERRKLAVKSSWNAPANFTVIASPPSVTVTDSASLGFTVPPLKNCAVTALSVALRFSPSSSCPRHESMSHPLWNSHEVPSPKVTWTLLGECRRASLKVKAGSGAWGVAATAAAGAAISSALLFDSSERVSTRTSVAVKISAFLIPI